MKEKVRLLSALLLIVMLASSISIPAFAKEVNVGDSIDVTELVYSEEYPDAYIESEFVRVDPLMQTRVATPDGKTVVGYVDATAYVEDTFTYLEEEDEYVQTDSRLLNKEEVDAIGKENFLESSSQVPVATRIGPMDEETKSRGTLSIRFTVYQYGTGGNRYQVTLIGTWERSFWDGTGSEYPGLGDDYVGLYWGGQFDYEGYNADAMYAGGQPHITPYLCDAIPNNGLVWSFLEYQRPTGTQVNEIIERVSCWSDVEKNTLTGGGNTTSFVGKYIHTYTAAKGSISFSASSGGVSAGFSLSGVSEQWSLACTIPGFPY